MLVCVNLLGPHCNEEKEPKEVEQEHLKQEKKYLRTNDLTEYVWLSPMITPIIRTMVP